MRFRGAFWSATVIGQVIFLIGVAAANAREGLENKMLWFDVVMRRCGRITTRQQGAPYVGRRPGSASPEKVEQSLFLGIACWLPVLR
jgi:hypothetical protein